MWRVPDTGTVVEVRENYRLVQPAQTSLAALAESPIDETKPTLGFGDGA